MQSDAFASQKFTWPTVTGAPPAVTDAVRATTVPAAIVVALFPPALMLRLTVLIARVCAFSPGVTTKAQNVTKTTIGSSREAVFEADPKYSTYRRSEG